MKVECDLDRDLLYIWFGAVEVKAAISPLLIDAMSFTYSSPFHTGRQCHCHNVGKEKKG